MAPEAEIERAADGSAPAGDGWFVLNATDARWTHAAGRGARTMFEGQEEFDQVGVGLYVLEPGEPMGMYHWEADQEDFLVLSGDALLLVEGEERPLRRWDFVHCPVRTNHIIVGAGERACVVLAIGAREHQAGPGWGGYPVDATALRHRAGVEAETDDAHVAYAKVPGRSPTAYRDGWLD